MRLSLALVIILTTTIPALAKNDLTIVIDRAYIQGSYAHVLSRIINGGERNYEKVRYTCDVFESDKTALGNGDDFVENVEAGKTVVGDLPVRLPPGVTTQTINAVCRFRSSE